MLLSDLNRARRSEVWIELVVFGLCPKHPCQLTLGFLLSLTFEFVEVGPHAAEFGPEPARSCFVGLSLFVPLSSMIVQPTF
jgi:hypothetical protein